MRPYRTQPRTRVRGAPPAPEGGGRGSPVGETSLSGAPTAPEAGTGGRLVSPCRVHFTTAPWAGAGGAWNRVRGGTPATGAHQGARRAPGGGARQYP